MSLIRRMALATVLTASIAAAPADAASIKGTWKGKVTITSPTGTGSYTQIVKVNALTVGKKGGKIQIPGETCRGPLIYKGRKGPKYLFKYRENSGDPACTGDDKITLSLVGGKLRWKGVSPDGSVIGRGTLRRV